jgi:hypothetical protein
MERRLERAYGYYLRSKVTTTELCSVNVIGGGRKLHNDKM